MSWFSSPIPGNAILLVSHGSGGHANKIFTCLQVVVFVVLNVLGVCIKTVSRGGEPKVVFFFFQSGRTGDLVVLQGSKPAILKECFSDKACIWYHGAIPATSSCPHRVASSRFDSTVHKRLIVTVIFNITFMSLNVCGENSNLLSWAIRLVFHIISLKLGQYLTSCTGKS